MLQWVDKVSVLTYFRFFEIKDLIEFPSMTLLFVSLTSTVDISGRDGKVGSDIGRGTHRGGHVGSKLLLLLESEAVC